MLNKTSEQSKEQLGAQRKQAAVEWSKETSELRKKHLVAQRKRAATKVRRKKRQKRLRLSYSRMSSCLMSSAKELRLRPWGEWWSLKCQSENHPMKTIATCRPTSICIGWQALGVVITKWAATYLVETEHLVLQTVLDRTFLGVSPKWYALISFNAAVVIYDQLSN